MAKHPKTWTKTMSDDAKKARHYIAVIRYFTQHGRPAPLVAVEELLKLEHVWKDWPNLPEELR
jgi:hypothetical protein